jgi:hypothetical protein
MLGMVTGTGERKSASAAWAVAVTATAGAATAAVWLSGGALTGIADGVERVAGAGAAAEARPVGTALEKVSASGFTSETSEFVRFVRIAG